MGFFKDLYHGSTIRRIHHLIGIPLDFVNELNGQMDNWVLMVPYKPLKIWLIG